MSDKPQFEFKMRAVPKDPTGYYFARWDLAEHITVEAKNRDEAASIAADMLGKNNRGWPWAFKFDSIKQVVTQS